MAAAVWYRARAQVRQSLAGAIVLALLVGIGCGVVIAGVAGARRTSSAFPRMLESSESPEILVSPNGDASGIELYDDIARLPGVEAVAPVYGIGVGFADDSPWPGAVLEGPAILPLDNQVGQTIDRPNVIEGRMWRPDRADEVVVNRFFADTYAVEVGDRLPLEIVAGDDGAPAISYEPVVVGITVLPQEVIPFTDLDAAPSLLMPPAMSLTRDRAGFEGAVVDAADGTDVTALVETIEDLATSDEYAGEFVQGLFTVDLSKAADSVQHSIRPLAVALSIFSVVLAVVVVVVIGQAIRRHMWLPANELAALEALGFRRAERRSVLAVRGSVIGAAAIAIALVVAVAASPVFPLGPARLAEPDRGVAIDWVVLAPGVLAILAFCAAAAVSTREQPSTNAADLVTPAARLKLSPAASAGLRAAWPTRGEGGGAGAVAAAIGGLVAVLAAATFSASLDDLVDRPNRYGQSWDRMVDGQFGVAPVGEIAERFGDDERVGAMAVGDYGEVSIDGDRVPAISWQSIKGNLHPIVADGREAVSRNEIALGGEILDRHGLEIGDTVDADAGNGSRHYEIVGEVVFPRLGLGSFAPTGLGVGAQLHPDGMAPASGIPPEVLEELPPSFLVDDRWYNFAALDVAGADVDVAALDRELDEIASIGLEMGGEEFGIRKTQRPTTIADLDRVRSVPAALALALAALAAATLAHSLWASLRSRRRELAILSALGFERRQLASTVLWHAGVVVLVAVVLAVPIGAAAGRSAWRAFASEFYVPAQPVVPMLTVAATAVAAIAVAGAIAWPAAHRAARTRPAVVLRAE